MLNGVNGPDSSPLISRAFQANDGGAGNLGYFQQGKKKKKEEKDEHDTIEISSKKEEEEEDKKEEKEKKPDSAGSRIKTFWYKIHGVFSEAAESDDFNQDDSCPF